MKRPAKAPPAAGPVDIAKWERLIDAAVKATEAPDDGRELVRARKATRKNCAMPRGQFYVGSPFHRFSEMSVTWTSVTAAGRVDLGPQFRALALQCRDIIEQQNNARRRADLED